jgi:potassium efflux system protein
MLRAIANCFCSAFCRTRGPGADGAAHIVVRVGVSQNADPDRVRALLEAAAHTCKLLRSEPAPTASFDNFGESSLDFSISAMAAETFDPAAAASDLRTRILRAFRAEGIELARPQHDIHLRDLDGLKAVLARIAAERAAREMGAPPPSGGR